MTKVTSVSDKSNRLDDLLDLPAFFDPIDRIEGVVFTFWNADWRGA